MKKKVKVGESSKILPLAKQIGVKASIKS